MAAQSEVTSFTPSPTGNKTINFNGTFIPSTFLLWCGPRSGTTETIDLASLGAIDIPNAIAVGQSNITDATGRQTKSSNTEWTHYNRVSGTLTKIISITGVSAAAGSITVNVGTANSGYTVYGIAIA
jgi:hypothetical protein